MENTSTDPINRLPADGLFDETRLDIERRDNEERRRQLYRYGARVAMRRLDNFTFLIEDHNLIGSEALPEELSKAARTMIYNPYDQYDPKQPEHPEQLSDPDLADPLTPQHAFDRIMERMDALMDEAHPFRAVLPDPDEEPWIDRMSQSS